MIILFAVGALEAVVGTEDEAGDTVAAVVGVDEGVDDGMEVGSLLGDCVGIADRKSVV